MANVIVTLNTRKHGSFELVLSEEFLPLYEKYDWRIVRLESQKTFKIIRILPFSSTVVFPRELLNAQPGEYVFYKDRDFRNNTKENLVKCTRSCYQAYHAKCKNPFGYKGVRRAQTKREGYVSRIMVNQEIHHIGTYLTVEEAARAYDKEAKLS